MQPISLYLHIPFCKHRCGYCDFNTYAGLDSLIPAYVDALIAESQMLAQAFGDLLPVHTIFFGGGTPSLLPAADIGKIIASLRIAFSVSEDAEISL
ncbi:MAG: radical SAM protein, partial [Anaerolineales bacterium]